MFISLVPKSGNDALLSILIEEVDTVRVNCEVYNLTNCGLGCCRVNAACERE